MLQIEQLDNGNLKLFVADADREDFLDEHELRTSNDSELGGYTRLWSDLFLEEFQPNGEYYGVAPEWIGALTDCPYIVTDDLVMEDDGEVHVYGDIWWYPNYMVNDPFDDIKEKGFAILTKA